MWYRISKPNEYLVITGLGIKNVNIQKSKFVWPLQRASRISMAPFDLKMNLQAMTTEKLQFSLPAVFTIGPDNDLDSLQKYALLLTSQQPGKKVAKTLTDDDHVQDIVRGIIEGETRVIVSSMTMEEIFTGRHIFKRNVVENVQKELDQFGLRIYNANVKELQDAPGSEYFTFLSKKAHEGASNQAKVDVANARMRGQIGEAECSGKSKQEISKIDAETAVRETQRHSEKAEADARLTNCQTNLDMEIELNRIKATRQAQVRDAELQRTVETKRMEAELERRRATDLAKSKVARESEQETAEAKLFSEKKQAEAAQYKAQQAADAAAYEHVKESEAALIAERNRAEADALNKRTEAQSMIEMAKGYAELSRVLGGPQGLMQLLMLQNGLYEKLATANGQALNGMQPKISVWNTGGGNDGGESDGNAQGTSQIRNLMQSLPPLFETIHEQTGISPPSWMAQMPETSVSKDITKLNGKA